MSINLARPGSKQSSSPPGSPMVKQHNWINGASRRAPPAAAAAIQPAAHKLKIKHGSTQDKSALKYQVDDEHEEEEMPG